jgi:small GTP-binding protein
MSRTSQSEEVRVVLVGNTSVGKTSLFERFQDHPFREGILGTVGGACAKIPLTTTGNRTVHLLLWDTAGQEAYRTIIQLYFRRAAIVLLVYDITRRDSFDDIDQWVSVARAKAPPCAKLLIIGNKSDLEENRVVSAADGDKMAQKHDAVFLETSAASGIGVPEVMATMADIAVNAGAELVKLYENGNSPEARDSPGRCC